MTAVTVILSDVQVAVLQAELNDYNSQQPEGTTPVDLPTFAQMVLAARGNASATRYGTIPVFKFVQRFDAQKYAAIVAAAATDDNIKGLFNELQWQDVGVPRDTVNVRSDKVTQGLAYLKSVNLLNDADIAAITLIG